VRGAGSADPRGTGPERRAARLAGGGGDPGRLAAAAELRSLGRPLRWTGRLHRHAVARRRADLLGQPGRQFLGAAGLRSVVRTGGHLVLRRHRLERGLVPAPESGDGPRHFRGRQRRGITDEIPRAAAVGLCASEWTTGRLGPWRLAAGTGAVRGALA